MVELPIELMDIILSFSSRNDFPRLSAVSRTWQFVIECHTMRDVRIKSTDLQEFSKIFLRHNRRAALKKLAFDVVLPSYSDAQSTRFETREEKQRNNEVLTDAVHSLFSILHAWDEEVGIPGNGSASYQRPVHVGRTSLILKAYSSADPGQRPVISSCHFGARESLYEERYQRSFLRIARCDELPTASRIRFFEARELCYYRRIEGASLARVAAKLPNLEKIYWAVNDDEKIYETVRQQHRFGKVLRHSQTTPPPKTDGRADFAQSLAMIPMQFLTRVDLTVFNDAPQNHLFKPPSALLPSAPSTDHLSLALHTLSLSPNLTHFHLSGDIVLSPCFFWPQDPAGPTPFWPQLQELTVELNITTPDGNWLYKRDPDDPHHYDDDEDVDALTLPDLLELTEILGIGPENETPTHSTDSEVPPTFHNERLQSLSDKSELELWFPKKIPGEELLLLAMSSMDGSEPVRAFRKILDGERLNPMLMAMARAARQMPAMRSLLLSLNEDSSSAFKVGAFSRWIDAHIFRKNNGIVDAEPAEEDEEDETAAMRKKCWFVSTGESKWSVPEEVLATWKSAGAEDDGIRIKVFQRT